MNQSWPLFGDYPFSKLYGVFLGLNSYRSAKVYWEQKAWSRRSCSAWTSRACRRPSLRTRWPRPTQRRVPLGDRAMVIGPREASRSTHRPSAKPWPSNFVLRSARSLSQHRRTRITISWLFAKQWRLPTTPSNTVGISLANSLFRIHQNSRDASPKRPMEKNCMIQLDTRHFLLGAIFRLVCSHFGHKPAQQTRVWSEVMGIHWQESVSSVEAQWQFWWFWNQKVGKNIVCKCATWQQDSSIFFRLCLKHGEGRNTCQRSPLQGHLGFRWLWGIVLGARAVALFLWNPDPARILVSKCMKFWMST